MKIAQLRNLKAFQEHLRSLGLDLPVDQRMLSAAEGSPLAEPCQVGDFRVGNRWCIHPMEGWDGTPDGRPSEHTIRRWQRFGQSGAKLIWGGEAFAVCHEGRANPNQLCYRPENEAAMRALLEALFTVHRERFGSTDNLLVGLQLTHSGRFSRPSDPRKLEPRIAYHHPLLDAKSGIRPDDHSVLIRDQDIPQLIEQYVAAARMAQRVGFQFVDIKACHGYLGHEFLSAYDRPGRYGGDFEGRARFLGETIQAVRAACPGLLIGVRLSIFDHPPFAPGSDGIGRALDHSGARPYPIFGCRRDDPTRIDLTEPIRLLTLLRDELGVAMVNLSAGSPYYCPHIQRPAYYPPCDGYQPPEDPLVGCVRQIQAVRQLKAAVPGLPMVGSAYTYFQQWLPQVAQAVVRAGWVDFVGIGRMVLAYPGLPADILQHGFLPGAGAKKLCRTFSDCTTAPRKGLISGCYPLDYHYQHLPQRAELRAAKQRTPGEAY